MPYVATDLGQVAVSVSADQLVQIFTYVSDENILTTEGADFFGDVDNPNERLKDGDIVYVQATDGDFIGRYDAASRSLATKISFA
jgi:hypothetical protein